MFILTVALVVAIIIAFGRDKSSTAINFASDLVAGEKVSIPQNENWQNELRVADSTTIINEATSTNEEAVTATDKLSVNLMSNYLALKQSGNLNQETAQQLIDNTTSNVSALGDKVALASELDLRVIPNNGKVSVEEYAEKLGSILKNNKPKEIKNETEIIQKAVESRDPAKIAELDDVIDVYKKTEEDLLGIEVPKIFVKSHLDMINGLRGIMVSLGEVKVVLSDPIMGLSAMSLYKQGVTLLMQALQATSVFVIQNNIVYKQGTGGYYLQYGI